MPEKKVGTISCTISGGCNVNWTGNSEGALKYHLEKVHGQESTSKEKQAVHLIEKCLKSCLDQDLQGVRQGVRGNGRVQPPRH
jgi:hypothetical protein